jgi:HD-like signal output (HDOD) protein
MGKIIFSSVHPQLLKKIRNFCTEKNIPASIFEDLSAGMNHAEIGALIAEKWNFPEGLICAIRFHHDPLSAPPEYKDLVEVVYLANMLCEYENGNASFEQFEVTVLDNFNFPSKKYIDTLIARFAEGFNQEKQ